MCGPSVGRTLAYTSMRWAPRVCLWRDFSPSLRSARWRLAARRRPCRPRHTQRVPPAAATLSRRRRGRQNGRPHLPRAMPVPHDARPLPRGAARLLLIRVPALSPLCACRSLPCSSSGWQRDNLVVSLRFEYTDAEYNDANSSMLAAIILTFICLAVQVRNWRPGDPPPPPARPPARPLCSA